MDESAFATFPSDVMVELNFVTELFLFFVGPHSTCCQAQRELGYSQLYCTVFLCLYGTLWTWRKVHIHIKYTKLDLFI